MGGVDISSPIAKSPSTWSGIAALSIRDGSDRRRTDTSPTSAAAGEVVAYFTAHHIGLEIESVNLCVGMVLLMVFAATLHDWLGGTASLAWIAFFTPSGPFAAGGILSEIAFGVLVGWILACSVTMLLNRKAATAT